MSARARLGMMRLMSHHPHRDAIDRACRRIDAAATAPDLATLAADAGLSPGHFQRLFKATVGLSPKRYALARRRERLGMTPRRLRAGGSSESIRHAAASTSLGPILVAATGRGICMVEFGAERTLLGRLRQKFPRADIKPADEELRAWIREVVALIDEGRSANGLPLDIRGTVFQTQVWQALTRLERGQTISYGELARQLGMPQGARAVARACAGNGIAVLVPCHRVVAADGGLAGYRWGIGRKRRLLEQEQTATSSEEDRPQDVVR